MFRRFRLSRKMSQATSSGPHARRTSIATSPATGTTFFDLPAEIRNEIYGLTASATVLRIVTIADKSKLEDPHLPGLLLASRQCRAEYLPILLATAFIHISVKNFNFSNVMRITGSLYGSELKALRANDHLTLELIFAYFPNIRSLAMESSLRTWATFRSAGMDRLPWHYALPIQDRMPRASGHSRFMLSYEKCMSTLGLLHAKVDEALQWELQIMTNELQLQGEVSGEYWRARYADYQGGVVRGW